MKLLLLCLCALVVAEQPHAVPSNEELTVGLQSLYRRFLHDAHPKELKLQDFMDIHYRNGMMTGPRFVSPVNANFEGMEGPHATFSYVNSLITPGQKGFFGKWTKHDTSDLLVNYHYGGAVKIHMVTEGGIHKEAFLGNPVYHNKNAKFNVMIPKNTYCTFESLSEDESTFNSYVAIPAWDQPHTHHYSNKEMENKFPAFAEMFHELAKPGIHHEEEHPERHEDSRFFLNEKDVYFNRFNRWMQRNMLHN